LSIPLCLCTPEPSGLSAPAPNPNLYGKSEDAKVEIEEAVAKANKDHQRVILVFGGNWCYDCHVLDQAFHQADVAPLLGKNFQVVHVNIGDDGKRNNDLAAEYQVPLEIRSASTGDPRSRWKTSVRKEEWRMGVGTDT
jgi:thioredoxin-related protein